MSNEAGLDLSYSIQVESEDGRKGGSERGLWTESELETTTMKEQTINRMLKIQDKGVGDNCAIHVINDTTHGLTLQNCSVQA